MNGKIQQLIDELENELSDFSNRTEKQIELVSFFNETKIEKLQAYLLSKGMPPELHVNRISDEDKCIICQIKRNGRILMTICFDTTGIVSAKLNDFVHLNTFAFITITEYEQLSRDFITIIHFFQKLDYEALGTKLHEIDFDIYDRFCDQYRCICNLKSSLSDFKNYMNKTEA